MYDNGEMGLFFDRKKSKNSDERQKKNATKEHNQRYINQNISAMKKSTTIIVA